MCLGEKEQQREGKDRKVQTPIGQYLKGKEENELGSPTLYSPGLGTALGNNTQGLINKHEFFSLYLAHI